MPVRQRFRRIVRFHAVNHLPSLSPDNVATVSELSLNEFVATGGIKRFKRAGENRSMLAEIVLKRAIGPPVLRENGRLFREIEPGLTRLVEILDHDLHRPLFRIHGLGSQGPERFLAFH